MTSGAQKVTKQMTKGTTLACDFRTTIFRMFVGGIVVLFSIQRPILLYVRTFVIMFGTRDMNIVPYPYFEQSPRRGTERVQVLDKQVSLFICVVKRSTILSMLHTSTHNPSNCVLHGFSVYRLRVLCLGVLLYKSE